jgi:hypothetical protein
MPETPPKFWNFFLLQFTKELIKNSRPKEFFIPQKEKIIQPRNFPAAKLKKSFLAESRQPMFRPSPARPVIQRTPSRGAGIFYVAEPKLPPRLQNIYPSPTSRDIDIGKLNPLVRDPAIKIIECNGPDEKIIVRGSMGVKPTGISLTRGEIDDIIDKFSEEAKIPVTEGIFNVAVGKLILTAIISEVVSPKFVIKKMAIPLSKPR